jgi:hypothetical protein
VPSRAAMNSNRLGTSASFASAGINIQGLLVY